MQRPQRSCCRRSPPTSAPSSTQRQVQDLPLLGRRYSELAFLVARRRRRAGRHHQPRRGHVLQRQRQLRDLEQLHARRRRQQLVLDQPAGAQPAGGAAAGRRAPGVQGPDAHLLGGVRQGGRRGDQRVDQAGHERVPRQRVRVLPRRGAQRQHLGQQPRRAAEGPVQSATSPAARSAARSSAAGRSSSATTRRRGPSARCRRRRPCRPRGCARRPQRADRQHGRDQPVRAGRLRRRGRPSSINRLVHRSGRRRG